MGNACTFRRQFGWSEVLFRGMINGKVREGEGYDLTGSFELQTKEVVFLSSCPLNVFEQKSDNV